MTRSFLVVLVGCLFALRVVSADPPPSGADVGADAPTIQSAFATGDLSARRGEPVEATDELARAFAWIRDSYWRPNPRTASLPERGERGRVLAHAVWLTSGLEVDGVRAEGDPLGGEADPMPIVTALVEDRIRRERTGRHSTRTEGPLSAFVSSKDIAVFLDDWVPGAYGGPAVYRNQDRAQVEAFTARVRHDASRNAWCAIGSILGLVLFAMLGGAFVGRWCVGKQPLVREGPASD